MVFERKGMIETPTIWNTGVPLLILGILGWVIPRILVTEATRSHVAVAVAVLCAVALLIAISALVLVAFDFTAYRQALQMGGVVLVAEIALRSSILFAVAWVPMVLLSWFNMAQRVEMWRGKDMASEADR